MANEFETPDEETNGIEDLQVDVEDTGEHLPGEDPVPEEPEVEFDLDELLGIDPIVDDTPEEEDFYANMAESMSETALQKISSDLVSLIEGDSDSRRDWLQIYVDGLELLGMKLEDRMEPWAGACGVYHPLLSEALVKFQAETIMEVFPASGPVKVSIIGKETPENKQAAENVKEDMNFQLTKVMTEYRPEHERMLWGLGLSGNAFKKVYYDPTLRRQTSLYVPAEDFIVPYGASNLDTAERKTHVMRKTKNEIIRLQSSGFYRDIDLGDPIKGQLDEIEQKVAEQMGFNATTDDRFKLYEVHVNLDMSEYDETNRDGVEGDVEENSTTTQMGNVPLPYIVTIDKSSGEVLSIYRNWAEEDEEKKAREYFVHYPYIPGFGFYAYGLIHLLGSFAKSGTSLIRQLVDAGTLSNLPGGFKTRGMRVKGDDTPISPGEFRDVDVTSGSLKENIMTLPYKEPSAVLFQLMQNIVEEGRKFASTTDLKISDMSSESPVGTTLAILERTLKVMSSVHSRVHYSMGRELKLLASIIRDFTPEEYAYEPENNGRKAKKSDYDMVEVIPVSDPNASTMAQKVTQWQAVIQLAAQAPQIYDLPELHRQMLAVLGVKGIEKIIPTEEDQQPTDPVSENMRILAGKPVKAFLHQDHQAHITAHMGMSNDPQIQQLIEGTPAAQTIASAGAAHVAEHLGMLYRKNIEDQLGVSLPPPDEPLPLEVEVQLSRMVAQAQQQLTQVQAQQAALAQQQQEQNDPLSIIQREELNIKKTEVELKKIDSDRKFELEKEKLKLEGAKIQEKSATTDKTLKAGVVKDLIKHKANQQERSQDRQHKSQSDAQTRAHQLSQSLVKPAPSSDQKPKE